MIDATRATWLKLRTWEVIQSRRRAGETIEALARDYAVPLDFITFVLFPENDIETRYARASDRTQALKTDRDRLDTLLRKLVIAHDAEQDEEFTEAIAAARDELGFVLADDADVVLTQLLIEHERDAETETDE